MTVHCWLSTIDGQVLMDLDSRELTVQILMVRIHYCWPTLGSALLNVNYWWSSVDGFGQSRVDNQNLKGVGVDVPPMLANSSWSSVDELKPSKVDNSNLDGADGADSFLSVNSCQSTVEYQLLMVKCCWI